MRTFLLILFFLFYLHLPADEVKSETINSKTSIFSENDFIFVKGGCFYMGVIPTAPKTIHNPKKKQKKLTSKKNLGPPAKTKTKTRAKKSKKGPSKSCLNDFYLGKFEITRRVWKKVMSNVKDYVALFEYREDLIDPHGSQGYPIENPVFNLSMKEIKIFLYVLNKMGPDNFRLPTEQEWEYAARSRGLPYKYATSTGNSIWYFANITLDENHEGDSFGLYSFGKPIPVASYPPSPLGFYDMNGNVSEWTTIEGSEHKGVLRGGNFESDPEDNEATNIDRIVQDAEDIVNVAGFRLVKIHYPQTTPLKDKNTKPDISKNLQNKIFQKQSLALISPEKRRTRIKNLFPDKDFVFVKSGCFEMGKLSDLSTNLNSKKDLQCVGDFLIGRYEVTIEQWIQIVSKNSLFNPNEKYGTIITQVPVSEVSWNDVQEFIKLLNEKGKAKYRLPTSAEWEYAARSRGGSFPLAVENGHLPNRTNLEHSMELDLYWNDFTHLPYKTTYTYVGTFPPNALGLYDMVGNLWEWVQDPYEHPVINFLGFPNRTIRGGSFETSPWNGEELNTLTTITEGKGLNFTDDQIGFRLVKINP